LSDLNDLRRHFRAASGVVARLARGAAFLSFLFVDRLHLNRAGGKEGLAPAGLDFMNGLPKGNLPLAPACQAGDLSRKADMGEPGRIGKGGRARLWAHGR